MRFKKLAIVALFWQSAFHQAAFLGQETSHFCEVFSLGDNFAKILRTLLLSIFQNFELGIGSLNVQSHATTKNDYINNALLHQIGSNFALQKIGETNVSPRLNEIVAKIALNQMHIH